MLSNFNSASRSSVEDIPSQYEPPPPYFNESHDRKNAVEVCEPPPNAEFEPVERQRHFGILRYTVNNRFKTLILIGIANFVLFILFGVVVIIILVTLKANKASTVEPDSCTPLDPTTFLFAYSNDFDPYTVNSVLGFFLPSNRIPLHYSKFAGIRFDTKNEEEFEYQNTFDEIVTYVASHLPDSSLSFDSNNTGSDVLRMIERFLDNTVVPVCGSKMIIFVKRYPNETDYSRIVAKMRQHHSYFTIFASNEPSGGFYPETLYDLASKTNGICAFDDDDSILDAVGDLETVFNPYLVYAANPQVSGNGCNQLPPLLVQYNTYDLFTMTMQDNGSMTVVQAVMLSWINDNGSGQLGKNGTIFYSGGTSGNHIANWVKLNTDSYNVQLDYNYTDSNMRRVQIRVNGDQNPIDYWVPYDN